MKQYPKYFDRGTSVRARFYRVTGPGARPSFLLASTDEAGFLRWDESISFAGLFFLRDRTPNLEKVSLRQVAMRAKKAGYSGKVAG
jgi:hypothetical protein